MHLPMEKGLVQGPQALKRKAGTQPQSTRSECLVLRTLCGVSAHSWVLPRPQLPLKAAPGWSQDHDHTSLALTTTSEKL